MARLLLSFLAIFSNLASSAPTRRQLEFINKCELPDLLPSSGHHQFKIKTNEQDSWHELQPHDNVHGGNLVQLICCQDNRIFISQCLEDGSWRPPLTENACSDDIIKATGCPPDELPMIRNGNVKRGGSKFGDFRHFDCNEGYEPDQLPVILCLPNGHWLANSSCVKVPACQKEPPTVENGRVLSGESNVGAIRNFECDDGFEPDQQPVINCLDTGHWEIKSKCVEIVKAVVSCTEDPPNVENGLLDVDESSAFASVTCFDGYEMQGDGEFQCGGDGIWQGETICVELTPSSCLRPIVENGQADLFSVGVESSGSGIGQEAREDERLVAIGQSILISCSEGFAPVGRPVSICTENVTWHPPLTECRVESEITDEKTNIEPQPSATVQCSLPNLAIGHFSKPDGISLGAIEAGELVQLVCPDGYKIDGSREIVCLSDGTWFPAEVGRCVKKEVIGNDSLRLPAIPGSMLVPDVKCRVPSIDNGQLVDAESGEVLPKEVSSLKMAKLICRQAYRPSDSANVLCYLGKWFPQPGSCEDDEMEDLKFQNHEGMCRVPVVANGFIGDLQDPIWPLPPLKRSFVEVGTAVALICSDGFFFNASTLTKTLPICQDNGQFSPPLGTCSPGKQTERISLSKCQVPAIEFGRLVDVTNLLPLNEILAPSGTWARLNCFENLRPAKYLCIHGSWYPQIGDCSQPSSETSFPAKCTVRLLPDSANASFYVPTPNGPARNIPKLPFSVKVNTTVAIRCPRLRVIQGASKFRCVGNGTWDAEPGKCIRPPKAVMKQVQELRDAVLHRDIEKAKTILREDLDPSYWSYLLDAKTSSSPGWTVTMIAASLGSLPLVDFFVASRGADVFRQDDVAGNMAIHYAADKGHLEVVKFLASFNKKLVEAKNNKSDNPLHIAAAENHLQVVKFLVEEAGANINSRGQLDRTPLILAAAGGHFEVVQFLVENNNGADVTARDKAGDMAVHVAAALNYKYIANFLLTKFPDLRYEKDGYGNLPTDLNFGVGH